MTRRRAIVGAIGGEGQLEAAATLGAIVAQRS
ncbi:hypothetical protein QFZ27_001919 [Inquilinus ginsengisoli]